MATSALVGCECVEPEHIYLGPRGNLLVVKFVLMHGSIRKDDVREGFEPQALRAATAPSVSNATVAATGCTAAADARPTPRCGIAPVRMHCHQPTKDYVTRRTAEGKTKTEIMRCLKRYIAREIYPRLLANSPGRAATA